VEEPVKPGTLNPKALPPKDLTPEAMAAAAQAVWWVFLVPIYQSPDEPAHLDYALGIHARGTLLFAQYTTFANLPTDAHPYTEYLRTRSSLPQVAFNPGAKMPPGYGTPCTRRDWGIATFAGKQTSLASF